MATTKYILTGETGTTTHIDLGLQVGDLSFNGQSFEVKGSDGDNSFFLRPAGYTFDFTDNGAGSDVIYLTGARADYTVSPPENGVVTLTRGAGETSETVRVSITAHDGSTPSNMTVVFSDGALRTDLLQAAGGETLDETLKSVDFTLPAESTGGVRVGAEGGDDQSNVFGPRGLSFTAIGNGGVDEIFVASGATVDATKLGLGKDRIYLEGNWGDYDKSLTGNQITLTRRIPNPLGVEEILETVKVIGGIGASNDRVLFADGSVDTRAMLLALRPPAGSLEVDITTDTAIWDSTETSFSSAAALEGENNLTLSVDSGVLQDDWITNNGVVNVSGLAEGYVWQYSIDGGTTWTALPKLTETTSSFTLEGQTSGDAGITYAAGQVQVRQINPFSVSSPVVSNAQDIIVDKFAEASSITVDDLPTLIEEAMLEDGALKLTGTAAADIASLELRFSDGNPETDYAVIEVTIDQATPGVWEATVTADHLAPMPEGEDISFSITAKDKAGNETDAAPFAPIRLELANDAPEVNPDQNIAPQILAVGEEGAAGGGTVILDLTDLNGDGVTDDPAFIDADAPGTVNRTLTYTATWNGGLLPDWLELVDGVLRIVAGMTAPVLEGDPVTLVVTATDGGGASASRAIVIDTLAAPSLLPEDDLGASSEDNLTNHPTPTIEGDLPAGVTAETVITIYRGDNPVASSAAGDESLSLNLVDGRWSYTPSAALAEGENKFSIEVDGVRSPEFTVTIDVTAAPAPAIEMQLNALVLNNSNGDGAQGAQFDHSFGTDATIAGWVYIGDADGVTETGSESQVIFDADGDMAVRIMPGGAIRLSANGVSTDTGFMATEGWHFIAVTRTAEGQSFYFDGVKSSVNFEAGGATPSFLRLGLGSGPGVAPLLNGAYRDLQVWNSALDEAALEAVRNGAFVDTGHPDIVGYWPLAETGAGAFANAAGGNGLVALGGADVGVFDDSDGFTGIVTAGAAPIIKGAGAEPGAEITVTAQSAAGVVTASTIVEADGTWRVTLQFDSLSSEGYTITATQTDIAGNESAVSNALVIRAPLAPRLDPGSDTGVAGDNITLDRTPKITGHLPEGYVLGEPFSIHVNDDDPVTVVGETAVNGLSINLAGGSWEYTQQTPLPIGDNTFQTSYNGVYSGTLVVTVEGLEAPVLDPASDTGTFDDDNITNDPTPTLTGGLPEGFGENSVVKILVGDDPRATVVGVGESNGLIVESDGTWHYTPTEPLNHGDYEFILEIDEVRSEPLSVSIDRVAEALSTPSIPRGAVRAAVFDNADATIGISGISAQVHGGDEGTIMARVFIDTPAAGRAQALYATMSGAFSSTSPTQHMVSLSDDGEFLVQSTSSPMPHHTGVFATKGWYHIAIVQKSDNTLDLYLDGEKVAENVSSDASFPAHWWARFGHLSRSSGRSDQLIDGAYKDIQIWTTALDAEDVAAASDGAEADIENPNLFGAWSLTESFANDKLGGEAALSGAGTQIRIMTELEGNVGSNINVATRQVLSGDDAEAGATVKVVLHSNEEGVEDIVVETVADEAGAWTIEVTMEPDREYTVSITQTDVAGNVSEDISPLKLYADPSLYSPPSLPWLDPASDTGVLGDNVTFNRTPTIRGVFSDRVSEGTPIWLKIGGRVAAFTNGGELPAGLDINYDTGEWAYTVQEPLLFMTHEVYITVQSSSDSLRLMLTVVESVMTITEQPALVQDASFDDNDNLEVRIQADAEAAVVTVSWDNGSSVGAQFDQETGEWVAVFSRTDMEMLADGAAAHFTVTAKDVRDNTLAVLQSDDVFIELVNEAPVRNDGEIGLQFAWSGVEGAIGGTAILDLTDIDGNEATEDAAFSDPDAPGSDNATLTYTLTLAGGGEKPEWLEVTRAGVLQVVEGMAPPDLDAPITVTVTATDGDNATATRDIQISSLKTPVLDPASDSGVSDTDNLTAVTRPTLSGEIPAGVLSGTMIKIYRGENVFASRDIDGENDGLTLDFAAGTWEYTPPAELDDGSYNFRVSVGDIPSAPLAVEIDATADKLPFFDITGAQGALVLNNASSSDRNYGAIDHDFASEESTISAWFHFEPSFNTHILHIGSSRWLEMSSNAFLFRGNGGAATITHRDIPAGWHHVAVVSSSQGSDVYLNGVKFTLEGETIPGLSGPIYLGRGLVEGAFRDVRVWDRSLDEVEVADAFAGGPVDLDDPALVGHWPLDTVSGLANEKDDGTVLTAQAPAEITVLGEAVLAGNPVISGTAEPDATVSVTAVGGPNGQVTEMVKADADGVWSITLTLSPQEDTKYVITARQTDLAGNVSDTSTPVTLLIQSTQAPVLSQDSDLGVSPFDRLTSDTTPTLTGALPDSIRSGVEIVIYMNNNPVASGSAAGAYGGLNIDYENGQWSYTPEVELASNEYEFVVSIGGVRSAPLTVTVDADPPAAPIIQTPFNGFTLHNENGDGADGAEVAHSFGPAATIAGWVYIGDSDGVTTSGSEAQVIFGADGDMEVAISTGGAIVLSAGGSAVDTGFDASQGWHYIAVTRDASGQSFYFNNKKSGADFSALGAAPSRLRLGLGDADGDRPLVNGAFSKVQLWDRVLSEAELGAAYDGAPPNMQDTELVGYWPFSETDASGLDNAKAGGPALTPLNGALVEVFPAAFNPVIRGGGAEPGAHIKVTAHDGVSPEPEQTVTAVADASGAWTVTLSLAPGTAVDYTITVTQTDAAGNESVAAQGIMRVSPDIIGPPVLDAASDTGLPGDNVTLDATPKVRGVLPPDYVLGEDFIVYVNDEEVARANTEEPTNGLTLNMTTGFWTYEPPETSRFDVGDYRIQGGFGGEIAPALTLMIRQPDMPKLESASDSGVSGTDNITNDATPTLSGDLPAGTSVDSDIVILIDDIPASSGLTINMLDNSWSYTPTQPLDDKVYEFVLKVDGARSAPLAVTIDTEVAKPEHTINEVPALTLSGQLDRGPFIEMRPNNTTGDDITVAGWVYIDESSFVDPPTSGTIGTLFDFSDNHHFLKIDLQADGTIRVPGLGGPSVTAGWHFFAFTIADLSTGSGDKMRFYWNSEEIFNYTSSFFLRDNQDIYLGSADTSRGLPNSAYRNLSVWDRPLSASEVRGLHAGDHVDVDDPDLLDYWPLAGVASNAKSGGASATLYDEAAFVDISDTDGFNGPFNLMLDNGVAIISGEGAELGSTIKVEIKGGPTLIEEETVVIDASGAWSVQPVLPVGGKYTVTIVEEDIAGNVSEPRIITVSTPHAAAAPVLAEGNDTGVSDTDNITSITRPVLTGDLPEGVGSDAVVDIFRGGILVATTGPGGPAGGLNVNFGTGKWDYQPTSDLAADSHDFRIAVNGSVSEALSVTVMPTFAGDVSITDAPFSTVMLTQTSEGDDTGEVGFTHSFRQSATVAAWVYISDPTPSSQQVIFEAYAYHQLTVILGENGKLSIRDGLDLKEIDHEVKQGWQHIAITTGSGGDFVYVNGVKSTTPFESGYGNTPGLAFGEVSSSGRGLKGAFRDAAVWDRTLSEAEIIAMRDGLIDLTDLDLVGYWPMNQESGFDNAVEDGPRLTVRSVEIGYDPGGVIETAVEEVVISGRLTADIAFVDVTWDDGDEQTDPTIRAVIDRDGGTWTATFTEAQMQQLIDGVRLNLKIVATDFAGNTNDTVLEGVSVLEATNEAPEANEAHVIEAIDLTVGDTAGAEGRTLLDLTNLFGGGEMAFVDPDIRGSTNATIISYSARLANGDELPSWLELTPEGVLRMVEGGVVDHAGDLVVAVTATDAGGAMGIRNIEVNTVLDLVSAVNGEASLDVRSSIVVETAVGEAIKLAETGTYKIHLVELTDATSKSGFEGDVTDGKQTITVTMPGDGGPAVFDGGTIEIVDGKAVISFDRDFDLSTTFGLEVESGLFVSAETGVSTGAIEAGAVRFSTVTPTVEGEIAQIWNAASKTMEAGATWFDGTGGNYVDNTDTGLQVDLSAIAGVVVIGHDVDATSQIRLNAQGRTMLTGFGGNDHIYIDNGFGHVKNDLSTDEITLGNNGGSVTSLTFTGAPGIAGVLISFANDPTTPLRDESTLAAISFVDVPGLGQDEHSFESITGNGQPVISG